MGRNLSKEQPQFSENDMRSEAEQFKLHLPKGSNGHHPRLMTTAVSRASFQTTIQSGRVMNQSEGESLFFMIRMLINRQILLGIFDTGSSDFITLKSCLQEPAQFLKYKLKGEHTAYSKRIRSCGPYGTEI